MKALKTRLRTISLLFVGMFLVYSCSTYTIPVSIEEATRQQKKVKIVTEQKATYKFNQIVFEDGQLYGENVIKGEKVKVPINPEEIVSVNLKKKGMPTWAIVVISALAATAIFIVIGAIALAS